MKTIANFSYAGTKKFVSHAVIGNKTLCGMYVDELLNRSEWEIIDHEMNFMGRVIREPVVVGCKKCLRLLTKPNEGKKP